ncbi:unnamed protein product, partial [Hymenolepis diminuta]
MEMMCPESCGYCNKTKNSTKSSSTHSIFSGSAKNVDDNHKDRYRYPADCEAWAKEGKCESNKLWMHFNCAKSCGSKKTKITPASKTTTTTTTTKEVTATIPICKDIYGTRNCQSLAAQNMCKSHKSWMMRQCAVTCGFCHLEGTTPKPMAITEARTTTMIKSTTTKKPITMMITTTARPITTKLVKTTITTKQTESHRK